MKLNLKKEKIEGIRFLGFISKREYPSFSDGIKLLEKIQAINSLVIGSEKVFYQVVHLENQINYSGPFLQIVGNTRNISNELQSLDYRDVEHYFTTSGVELEQLARIYLELKTKLGQIETYISLEYDKIELHIFKK